MRHEQLWLDGFRRCGYEDPWSGRSPRVLTCAQLRGIFKAQAEKSVSDFVRSDQLELFEAGKEEGPLVYQGAPLLLPFDGG